MKLLVVAATNTEIDGLIDWLKANFNPDTAQTQFNSGSLHIDILITGVGIHATTYTLTRQLLTHKYDHVLQAGVGGSFDKSIELGAVVFVSSDLFADLGAEDKDNYLDIFEMGLIDDNTFPYTQGKLTVPHSEFHKLLGLKSVTGLTVNTVSGSTKTIASRTAKFGCAVESMEGAAFHYVCLQESIGFTQIRAISNYVTPRDKSLWKMKDAIISLNKVLIELVQKLPHNTFTK